MANYEDAAAAIDAITSGDAGMSPTVAAAIIAALGGAAAAAAATEIATAPITDANVGSIQAEGIIANEGVTIDATFTDASPVVAVVTGTGTNNNNIDMSAKTDDVTVVLSGGTGDSVDTGSGSDTIEFRGGSATIDAGAGNDVISIGADEGSASVDGGTGFDRVSFQGGKGGHLFEALGNGKFAMHSGNINMENINVVTFDDGDGVIDDVAVLASTAGESLVAKLYQIGLGRDILDSTTGANATPADNQLAGYNWWTNYMESSNADLMRLTQDFIGTTEFQAKIGSLGSAAAQVAKMFANLGVNGAVDGITEAQYVDALNNGAMTLAEVVLDIATSAEATQILGVDGENYVIDGGNFFA